MPAFPQSGSKNPFKRAPQIKKSPTGSRTFVLGGAVGFALLKNETSEMLRNFGDGAVYFGWLGLLVGLVAIAGNAFGAWGSVEKMGPALAVSMLPLFYGYTVRLICMAVGKAKTAE